MARVWIIAIFVLIVILAIFLAVPNTTQEEKDPKSKMVPSSESVTSFIRNIALEKSHTNLPVPILSLGEPMYNGLFVVQANLSLFELAKMAFELKPGIEKPGNAIGAYKHRHNFEVITSSFHENLPVFLPFIKLLAQSKCHFVSTNDHNDNGEPHYLKLIKSYSESSSVYSVYELESENRCVSQLIFEVIYKECKLDQFPHITYYVTSTQREEEVRKAYKDDRSFVVRTVTGLIHSCVLKTMFPFMNVIINEQDTYNDPLFGVVKDFCKANFLLK
jgi:hypothetical protein